MSEEHITLSIKQTNTNNSFDVIILKSNTIKELKLACQEKTNLLPENQNLVYKGRILSDEKLLSDYNIGNGHTIILVKKMSSEEKEKAKTSTSSSTTTTTNMYGGQGNIQTNLNTNNPFGRLTGFGGLTGSGNLGGLGGMGNLQNLDTNQMNQALNMMSDPAYQQMMNSVSLYL
jgi:hypothetical protein